MPENPGGEDAVEERLDEGGLEKVGAFFTLEVDAERFAESFFHRFERAHGRDLDTGAGFASIAGKEGGEVFVEGLDLNDAALGLELAERGVAFVGRAFSVPWW